MQANASAQKCGGVQRNSTAARISATGDSVAPAAADPARTAKLPDRPPMTMFSHVLRFSHTV